MSVDPEVYYNPDCEPVDMSVVVAMDDTSEMLRQKADIEQAALAVTDADDAAEAKAPKDPGDEAMDRIRELLNLKRKKYVVEKPVFVPEVLDAIQSDLNAYVMDIGLEVTEIINIQYGKKIKASLGLKKAEVNLFYGKKGFSVVVSPRTGTDDSLNGLLAATVQSFINER